MDFTERQLDLLYSAWVLSHDDKGLVPADSATPDAEELADHNWLERRPLENGDVSYFWTHWAETALGLVGLTTNAHERTN